MGMSLSDISPQLTYIKAGSFAKCCASGMWHAMKSPADVPADQDLRLAVIDAAGTVHALVFPCRRIGNGWIDAKSRRSVEVYPTHWQEWARESK